MSSPAGVDASTWAALLRWSMKEGISGDGTAPSSFKPMSQEDKAWLTKVMSEGVVDLVKRAGEILARVKEQALTAEPPALTEDAEAALLDLFDELQDIVEQIDFAQNLIQIGGLPPLLEVIHPARRLPLSLRCASLGVIATVLQNNHYAQNACLNLKVMPLLLHLLTADESESPSLRLKALHCMSCLIRNYAPSEESFLYNGAPDAAAAALSNAAAACTGGPAPQPPAQPPVQPPEKAPAQPPAQPPVQPSARANTVNTRTSVAVSAAEFGQQQWAQVPAARASAAAFFTAAGAFVEQGVDASEAFEYSPSARLTGPQVIARCLADPDVKIRRKAAFLLNALACSDGSSGAAVDLYFEACASALVALVPPKAHEGKASDLEAGMDVDLRETALRALASFCARGKGPALMAGFGSILQASQEAAVAYAKHCSADDKANADAEMTLWETMANNAAAVVSPCEPVDKGAPTTGPTFHGI